MENNTAVWGQLRHTAVFCCLSRQKKALTVYDLLIDKSVQ